MLNFLLISEANQPTQSVDRLLSHRNIWTSTLLFSVYLFFQIFLLFLKPLNVFLHVQLSLFTHQTFSHPKCNTALIENLVSCYGHIYFITNSTKFITRLKCRLQNRNIIKERKDCRKERRWGGFIRIMKGNCLAINQFYNLLFKCDNYKNNRRKCQWNQAISNNMYFSILFKSTYINEMTGISPIYI